VNQTKTHRHVDLEAGKLERQRRRDRRRRRARAHNAIELRTPTAA
jgi:hypothetical protein